MHRASFARHRARSFPTWSSLGPPPRRSSGCAAVRERSLPHGLLLLTALACGVAAPARAQRLRVGGDLVALDSEEGRRLLLRSGANTDFFELAGTLETQQTQAFCGVASAVSVLNALSVAAPVEKRWSPYRAFTQDSLFGRCVRGVVTPESVGRGGMTMAQLASLLQCHAVRATVTHADTLDVGQLRRTLAASLARRDDLVIANYDRATLGQEGYGHLSPLGAYDAESDRVLVMDVARYKYPPVWVPAARLLAAMQTTDPDAGQSRGFVTVSVARRAPGPVPTSGGGLLRWIAAGLVGGGFLVGLLLGVGVMALRGRRARRRAARAG